MDRLDRLLMVIIYLRPAGAAHLGRPVGSSHGDACSDWADGAAHDLGAALTSASRCRTPRRLILRCAIYVTGHAYRE